MAPKEVNFMRRGILIFSVHSLLHKAFDYSRTVLRKASPSPRYVLLHHVMAQACGMKGAWGYPEGGMGGVTQAMARAATEAGAHLFTNKVIFVCVCT